MKKIIIALTLCSSFGAYAQTSPAGPNSFERGFLAGKASCEGNQLKEFWVCKITNHTAIPNCKPSETSTGSGRSRAEAVSRMDQFCLADSAELGVKPTCTKL